MRQVGYLQEIIIFVFAAQYKTSLWQRNDYHPVSVCYGNGMTTIRAVAFLDINRMLRTALGFRTHINILQNSLLNFLIH